MNKDKQQLFEYLQSNDLLSLATMNESSPNICIVYYGIENNFTFYIVTSPKTEHGKNIKHNSAVACSVYDSHQEMYTVKHKKGLQIYGTITQVTSPIEMAFALKIWTKGKRKFVNLFMKNIQQKIWNSKIYKIQPKRMKWFNEELYGEEGIKEFFFP